MNITEVKKMAHLSRLNLSAAEETGYVKELTQIFNYIESLNELDLSNVKPTSHAVSVENIFREDVVVQSTVGEAVLKEAPDHNEQYFLVPKVL